MLREAVLGSISFYRPALKDDPLSIPPWGAEPRLRHCGPSRTTTLRSRYPEGSRRWWRWERAHKRSNEKEISWGGIDGNLAKVASPRGDWLHRGVWSSSFEYA